MSRSFNRVMMIGDVADEPSVRACQTGSKVVNVTLVTNEEVRDDESGDLRDVVERHRLFFCSDLANVVEKYVHKGSRLFVEGRLETRSYTDRGVSKHNDKDIICDNLIMLETRRNKDKDE